MRVVETHIFRNTVTFDAEEYIMGSKRKEKCHKRNPTKWNFKNHNIILLFLKRSLASMVCGNDLYL